MWISYSPDLHHWGNHELLLEARDGAWWDAGKIGLCAPPLKTEEGWLIAYHGVKTTCSGALYRVGLALLHLEAPWEAKCRSSGWAFGPSELYERVGDVGNVVFPCGWVETEGLVRMYYGAADTRIGVAEARVGDILAWLKAHAEEAEAGDGR
jgi:predicted GH43/DUF377 family glycosyl hydrolase